MVASSVGAEDALHCGGHEREVARKAEEEGTRVDQEGCLKRETRHVCVEGGRTETNVYRKNYFKRETKLSMPHLF